MLPQKIENLKSMLVKENDFGLIMWYFLDEVTLDPKFMTFGRSHDEAVVRATFGAVVQALAQQAGDTSKQAVEFMLPIQFLEAYQLYHGAVRLGASMGILFLFRDIDMGLGSLTRMSDGYTHYSRFSCQMLDAQGTAGLRRDNLH